MHETKRVSPFDAPPVPLRLMLQPLRMESKPEQEAVATSETTESPFLGVDTPGNANTEPAKTVVLADAAVELQRREVVVQQVRHERNTVAEDPPSPPPLEIFIPPRVRRAQPSPKLTIQEQPPAPKRPRAIAWICLVVAIIFLGLLGVMTIASGDEIQDAGSLAEAVPPETLADDSTCQAILRPDKFPQSEGKFGAVCGGAVYRVDLTEKMDGKYVHTWLVYLPGVTPL